MDKLQHADRISGSMTLEQIYFDIISHVLDISDSEYKQGMDQKITTVQYNAT